MAARIELDVAAMAAAYEMGGLSIRQVGALFYVSHSAARARLVEAGVTLRRNAKLDRELAARIRREHGEGASQRALARRYRVDRRAIRDIVTGKTYPPEDRGGGDGRSGAERRR